MQEVDSSQEDPTRAWKEMVSSWYPEMAARTYVVPPVHFNRVTYRHMLVPVTGQIALILRHPDDATNPAPAVKSQAVNRRRSTSPEHGLLWDPQLLQQPAGKRKNILATDFQDDFAQNHVMTNLEVVSRDRKDAMFIMSQLSFGQYLNKPAYHAAVEMLGLPLPKDLDTKEVPYSRGEADVVVFHPRHGVLIVEIKSVGRSQYTAPFACHVDKKVAERISKAILQLERSEKVISHLVSDIAPRLTVRKTLFLPYLRQVQLIRTLCLNTVLSECLCQCLGASDMSEAVDLCVCADQLSDPDTYWDVTPAVLSKLSAWWRHRMAVDDPLLCGSGGGEIYLDIVSRFVGPASTVSVHAAFPPRLEVRTAGQAVAELGQRLSRLVLTPQQLDLLTRDPPRICITGPPGTGKTVVLALQGLRRLREGIDVHVISTDYDTLAASYVIQHQLDSTLKAEAAPSITYGNVSVHHYDFKREEDDIVDKAVNELKDAVREGTLCVIMDESSFHSSVVATGPRCVRLLRALTEAAIPQLFLWCACVAHGDVPDFLQEEKMDTPLRSSPAVLREVSPALGTFKDVTGYGSSGLPAPGDGPSVERLRHEGGQHEGEWPVECPACGREVAQRLRQLGVGAAASKGASSSLSANRPLRWRDVFVITRNKKLQDDVTDRTGQLVTSPACGFVRGLREREVPTLVLDYKQYMGDPRYDWQQRVAQVARGQRDAVTVSNMGFLHGLERPLVVWLVGRDPRVDGQGDEDWQVDARDRLYVASRCTTQLFVVTTPSWPLQMELEKHPASHFGKKKKL